MKKEDNTIKIWLISDTHGRHDELEVPEGIDMVICSGDMGTYKNPDMCKPDLEKALEWLNNLDVDTKIYVAGNHDTAMEAGMIHPTQYKWINFLNHESMEADGIKIFGSPYNPVFHNWAYNRTPLELKELWKDIPADTDILVTHSPPKDILDRCYDGYRAGCPYLFERVASVRPKIHVFGHIHEDGGREIKIGDTIFYNASVLDLNYQIGNNGHIINFKR